MCMSMKDASVREHEGREHEGKDDLRSNADTFHASPRHV
jgi:hypothetical protein